MNGKTLFLYVLYALTLAACSGGDPAQSETGTDAGNNCTGDCAAGSQVLAAADVQRVIAQAVHEAQAQGVLATIAIVDRVGNVLAVYRMGDAAVRTVTLSTAEGNAGAPPTTGGLEGITLPITGLATSNLDDLAAIAKAVTGAYLSSEGNAFSTRTANQIVQDHFNPGERFQPAGPLFGVQFSQLACSDFVQSFNGIGTSIGPHRSPLGLSADPGGFPVYKDGTVVGGVGVLADGVYGIDRVITDSDRNPDEMIAYASTFGFAAPQDRRGDQITVEGKAFRFSDVDFSDLLTNPADAPAFSSLPVGSGALVAVTGYTDGVVRNGTRFGENSSGVAPDPSGLFPNLDAFAFVDAAGTARFPPTDATDGGLLAGAELTSTDVASILRSALAVANRSRAQIRRPLGTPARVTISVVDTQGSVLGIIRSRDAPIFGADVSLQKARTATLLSSATAATFLSSLPSVRYLTTSNANGVVFSMPVAPLDYVTAARDFLDDPNALASGDVAFSDRAGGNLARPFYPDGVDTNSHGPLSKPQGMWSPFSTGLQLDASYNAILQHVLFATGVLPSDASTGCAGVQVDPSTLSFTQTLTDRRAGNGLQIFPGSVPIYRNDTLVGGIGISGDGVDQDDMIAFLGLHNAGLELANGIGNAPLALRADNLTPQGVRLRYVQCPQAPFIDSAEDNVCVGK